MKTIDVFCQWWGVGTPVSQLPTEIYMTCLTAFGATAFSLTYGSEWVLTLGKELCRRSPHTFVISGEFTGNPVPGLEKNLRVVEIGEKLIFAGRVLNTIGEAQAWKNTVQPSFFPYTLVVVTDEMHSRSARRVSNRVWNGWWGLRIVKKLLGMPLVRVLVTTFPTREAIDPQSPMTALRSQWLWVRTNVLRECFLMFVPFGFSIMKWLNIHQPIASDGDGE